MDRRDFVGIAVAAGGLLLFPCVDAQNLHINEAINKSGRQRMLSQRIAKAYLQIGQSVDLMRSNRIFSDSIALFERQLLELESFAPSAENKVTLAETRKTWGRYRDLLRIRAPNRKDALAVISFSDEVLALAQAGTVQLEKISGSASARLVNLSGRQRMLSQRMAKFYQAINWEIPVPEALQKLVASRSEFLNAMNILVAAPQNTDEITRELALAQQQWFFFDEALKSGARDTDDRMRAATNVATTSERILETMNRITGMYETLG